MTTNVQASGLDWRRARALAAGRFGLGPREFWALSLADWRALCAPPSADDGPPRRADVDALLARFPDDDGHTTRPLARGDQQ